MMSAPPPKALFVKGGHRVMFSSRHPDTLKGLADELGPLARAGTVAEDVEFGDVVMVVVPYTAMEQIGKDYGNALARKVLVIDVSNPIAHDVTAPKSSNGSMNRGERA